MIEKGIKEGRFAVGEKLPPQRILAYELGVATATIGKAYRICTERALVEADVGRGTFVLPPADPNRLSTERLNWPVRAQLSGIGDAEGAARMHSTSPLGVLSGDNICDHLCAISQNNPAHILDYPRKIQPQWQRAGALWMKQGNWQPDSACIVPTNGAYVGLVSAALTLSNPGDRIAVETPGYAAAARTLKMMGRRIQCLPAGALGLDVETFRRLCAQTPPRALIVTPTIQNPLGCTMPHEQRLQIVEIARRYDVYLIEDNVYGLQKTGAPPCFAELAPERSFHVSSLSKTVSSGLRAGWIACPPGHREGVLSSHRSLCGNWPYLMQELAAQLVMSGDAHQAAAQLKREVGWRHAQFTKVFGEDCASRDLAAPFVWVGLPATLTETDIAAKAKEIGVIVNQASEFFMDPADTDCNAVRIAFTGIPDRARFCEVLQDLQKLADHGPLETGPTQA